MRLKNILATPHPFGNQIELTWVNPDLVQFPGVRVVRRRDSHPVTPIDGDLVVEGIDLPYEINDDGEGLYQLLDTGPLRGETVYYYAFFPYESDPPDYVIDRYNRASAMVTAPYDLAGQMAGLLPGIYHRYDTAVPHNPPDEMLAIDRERGFLRRFLDLPGGQLDQSYSFIRALLDLHNLDRVDGRLLPLLAQWIGWKTDYKLEIESQRNEIRQAPAIYQTVGIIPTVEATVKRISRWESRTKEFVHNVFRTNQPERLNIWSKLRNSAGVWDEPTTPLSLDFAYEGRPAAVRDGDGLLWLFYQTLRKGRWDIWFKTLSTFTIDISLETDLDDHVISTALIAAFAAGGFILLPNAVVATVGDEWMISDDDQGETYRIREDAGQLRVYRWTPSQPLTNSPTLDRHPATAVQGSAHWLFWDVCDEETQTWRIDFCSRSGDDWTLPETFTLPDVDPPVPQPERKRPLTVADDAGGLWLFWLEKVGTRWLLKYNRHDGIDWELDPAADFPLTAGGDDPRVEGDPFVLFHPSAPAGPLWVFWARQEATAVPGQTRWSVVYRTKGSLNTAVSDWSDINTVPKAADDDHDREPAAIIDSAGNIELFWSSNRDGSYSVWRNTLDVAADTWGTAEAITETPYSQRDPLPLAHNDSLLLLYRANQSLTYQSQVYGATETTDFRYVGATTAHTRNTAKIGLRQAFEDFQTYTYDAGQAGQRTNDDWYGRDTIGLYLAPDTMDDDKINNGIIRISRVLAEFMPITDRVVFITKPDLHTEHIYTYALPGATEPRFIGDSYNDDFVSALGGGALGPDEDFADDLGP
ncbi:MAG: hypothetical protein GY803_30090 [Chloroflexi bacterium]|nr:hypothetical protein [Chloroflexota bacterium]